MKTQTKMLFGGALLSAGMAADVSAQQFQLSGTRGAYDDADTLLRVNGYDYYALNFDVSSVDGGIGDSLSYDLYNPYNAGGSGYGSALISPRQIAATSYANGFIDYDGFIQTRASAAVTVDRDATLELAWDFTRAGFEVENRQNLFVSDETNGVLLFDAPLGSMGTQSIEVFAGVNYVIGMRVAAGAPGIRPPFGPFSISFASVTLIPAPASGALLDLGTLAAARCRR